IKPSPSDSMERMEASRSCQLQFVGQRRLASTAHAGRSGHHLSRTSNMKPFLTTLTLLVFTINSARALTESSVHVVGTDHNWTIHLGDHHYGISGNNAVAIPGLRMPNETRIHVGARMYSSFSPFYCVAGIGLGC